MTKNTSSKILSRKAIATLIVTSVAISGCIGFSHSEKVEPVAAQSADASKGGLIGAVRLARDVRNLESPTSLLGFLPMGSGGKHAVPAPKKVIVDISTGKVVIQENGQQVSEFDVDLSSYLKKGVYKIVHKQRSPLWYAPDTYFTERHLDIPAEGDELRFRRGALGDFALFLDNSMPVYSSPLNVQEIGGINLEEDVMKKIYYSLDIGTEIEVR